MDKLNWNDLRFFLEVARKTRLLGAAKRLGVNHTTVARRISALEDALNIRLFERTEQGFHLTHAGEALLPLAEQVENSADLAKERVQLSGDTASGTLRIGAPDGFGNAFLASRLVPFMHDNPDLTIELLPVPFTHNLMKREVDLAISLEPTKRPNISNEKITDYILLLYTSHQYIKEKGIDITNIDSFFGYTFADYIIEILYTEQLNFNHFIDPEKESQFQSSTVLAQYEFVANGGGFGVLPYFMAYRDSRLLPVLTEQFNFVRSYWFLTPHDLQRFARVRRLKRFIMSVAKKHEQFFTPDLSVLNGSELRRPVRKFSHESDSVDLQ